MNEHHYLIRGGLEGRERLRVLGRVMRPTTLALLERAGVTSGMRVVDVGCGGGDVTFDLASLVGLTGSALGIDIDETKIELARADAEQVGVTNVEFRVGDLTDGLTSYNRRTSWARAS
ncbi:MAG TPA: methyltransferase domain-containing protein [Nocardioides sp.]|nr:methyltransferase domain-containing protein [Nocardioides sp.]